ncbi:MAG: hypothetical protein K6T85_08115 [Gorillibacterium sp.]|nr:hypothetical protein [Gorillibacterium sp.]
MKDTFVLYRNVGPFLFLVIFICGSAMLWLPLAGRIHFSRMNRLSLLIHKQKSYRKEPNLELNGDLFESKSPQERKYIERSRIAGMDPAWTYRHFCFIRGITALVFLILTTLFWELTSGVDRSLLTWKGGGKAFGEWALVALIGWWIPAWFLIGFAAQARSRYLMEIAKLSERLALCVNEKADTRDILLRAGRTLVLLKPHIQELAAMWGKNQHVAIWRFKEAIGISEVFPLVNALYAISRAEEKDVVKVLQEQTRSIDATLESDINRRIENAPVWISFYIMIPFSCVVLLFLYPWIVTIQSQLMNVYP